MVARALLYPDSVAVIGASRTPGKFGYEVLASLVKGGFKGRIIPVNPNADTLLDLPCYPDLKSCGENVDLCVISLPPESVKDAVEMAIEGGAKAIIVVTAGFKEVGKEGARLEKEIAEICSKSGVRLMGPNCLGLINTDHNMNASLASHMPIAGNISIISQSGALCMSILDWAAGRHLGLAKFVSMGNKADLNEIDFLEAFKDDENTGVIVGYLETISSGDEFVKVAESVASVKPVVILKVGTTEAGLRATSRHTGETVKSDIAYGAAFKRSGVIRAHTFEELLDYATALALQPLPNGDRIAVITNAGGPGIMAIDAIEELGMQVAKLPLETTSTLKQKLPEAASVGNPIDILGDAGPERYADAVTAAQECDDVDAIILILTPQVMTKPADTVRAVASRLRGEKPLLAAFLGGHEVMPGREELAAANLPHYRSPERAVMALKAMVDYAAWRNRPPRIVTRFPVNRRRVDRVISRYRKTGHVEVGEVHAKEILRAYDFSVPEGFIAATAEEAVENARRIGFPVAMKIISRDVIHKSNVGGVKLNISDVETVQDTFELMMIRVHRRAPEARLEGVYIEEMVPPGLEVIIGMTRDPEFGPMLMFGLGGIFVDVMEDETFYLAPITEDEAMQMLMATRSYALLKDSRRQAGVDLQAIAGGLQHISQLATDFPQIAEISINPFLVREVGRKPVVVDAWIILTDAGKKDG